MKHKDGKPTSQPDKNSRTVPMALMFLVLCGFSFYLGGIFCSEKDKYVTKEVTKAVETSKEKASGPLQIKAVTFPECSANFQDYTPCTDPKVISTYSSFEVLLVRFQIIHKNDIMLLLQRWKKYSLYRLSFMERHCPPVFEKKECLVPPPDGYKLPIRWPKSKNECWYRYYVFPPARVSHLKQVMTFICRRFYTLSVWICSGMFHMIGLTNKNQINIG